MIRWKSLTDIDGQLKKVLTTKEYYQGPGGMESKAVFHLQVPVNDSDDDSDKDQEPDEDSDRE
jgi:hypothetical protein